MLPALAAGDRRLQGCRALLSLLGLLSWPILAAICLCLVQVMVSSDTAVMHTLNMLHVLH